jgi:hypothetical protein
MDKCFRIYTPKSGRKIALFRYGEWIEVYPNEILLAHKDHETDLINSGFKRVRIPKVYRTVKEAMKHGGNRLSFTE